MIYGLELLHDGYFAQRSYITYAGLYNTLTNAQEAVPGSLSRWQWRELVVGKYRYPMWEYGQKAKAGVWWRIMPLPE